MGNPLEEIVRSELPEFYKMCKDESTDRVILHHAAFSEEEVCLLGTAVKYATEYAGKNVHVICDQ